MNARMFDVDQFIGMAREAGCRVEPDDAALKQLVTVLFLASLLTEEGKPCRMRVLLTGPGVNLGAEKEFGEPIDLDPHVFGKLSFLLNPEEMCLHVQRTANGGARIVGIGGVPNLPRESDIVDLEVTGPARVRLRTSTYEMRYESATYQSSATSSLLPWLPDSVRSAIHTYCTTQRRPNTIPLGDHRNLELADGADDVLPEYDKLIRDSAPVYAVETIGRIASRVARAGFGGGILVLASEDSAAFEHVRKYSRTLRTTSSRIERWSRPMIDSLVWATTTRLGHLERQLIETRDPLHEWIAADAPDLIRTSFARWRTACNRYADLTRVDGVLVLDHQLEPIHIGTKLQRPEGGTDPAYEETLKTLLDKRGTRHGSMSAAAWDLPNSLCVVISQDGHVTFLRRRHDQVRHSEPLV